MAVENSGIEREAARIAVPGVANTAIPSADRDAEISPTQQRSSSPSLEPEASSEDVEARAATVQSSERRAEAKADIEHMPVYDDPRLWSRGRKYGIVAIVSAGALSESRRCSSNRCLPCYSSMRIAFAQFLRWRLISSSRQYRTSKWT